MQLSLDWFSLIVLFGAVQGLIFSIILFLNRKHPGARFLSAFVFILAYNGFETFSWASGLGNDYIFFDLNGFIIIYGLGPSLYLYVASLIDPERKFTRRELRWHYSPVIFQFVTRYLILIYHLLWINKLIPTTMHSNVLIQIVWFYAEPLSVVWFVVYLIASWHIFRKARRNPPPIRSIPKEGQRVIYRWLNGLLISMVVMGIVWPLTILWPYVMDFGYDQHYYPIEIFLVFFIYWIALTGYHRTRSIYIRAAGTASALPDHTEATKHLATLKQAMEHDKLYLDPDLNVARVAAHTGISAKTLSAILNQYEQQSFNDFVNAYRVQEVQALLLLPENRHLTLSGVALEAGFNSQATFQRAFKGFTGMTPKEYASKSPRSTVHGPQ